jgi:PAS domain S-box-containing protein
METCKKIVNNPRSINSSIVSITIIAAALMSLLFGGLNLVIARYSLKSHVDTKAEHVVEKLEKILSVPVINQDYVQIINIIDEETKSSELKYIWLLDGNGIVLACNDETQLLNPLRESYKKDKGFLSRRFESGGYICLLPDYSIINSVTFTVLPWILLSLIIVIAAVYRISNKMIRKITLPILNAVEASASMAKGDFAIDLPESSIMEINDLNRSLTDTAKNLNDLTLHLNGERDDLTRSREEIRSLSEFRESIIDNANIWLNVLDKDFRVIVWNKAAEEISGYSREEVLGSDNIWDLLYPDRAYRESIVQRAGAIINNGAVVKDMITVIIAKNGDEKTISWYSKNLTNEEGVPTGSIAMGIDMTEKIKAEETLQQAQKMETVGVLAGGIAHDFNNILMGIVGTLSLFEFKLSGDENISRDSVIKYITTIQNSAERARDLVNRLLTLSRKQKLELKSIDLNTAVQHVVKICQGSFDKSIEIIYPENSQPAYVYADLSQIEQVILNFCVNASHAMTIMRPPAEKWGGTMTISLIMTEDIKGSIPVSNTADHFWQLSVSDTGIGMSRSVMRRIFDPFFTTKDKGMGTGLGLSMAYNIIKAHDGFINVYSEPGEGSVFNIYLPVLKTEFIEHEKSEEAAVKHGSGLVLVVDDEEVNRDVARMMLEDCGYQVITASDGVEAVAIYRERMSDIKILILDIVMPVKSGDEACIEILEINPGAKIVVSSGFRDDLRVKKALKAGAKIFVPKPYTLKTLSDAIDNVINSEEPD